MTREEAIKTIEVAIAEVEWEYPMDYAAALEMAIKALRTPEVVQCRECKHSSLPAKLTQIYGKKDTLTCHYGPCNRRNVGVDDFCSYGARKGGDGNG